MKVEEDLIMASKNTSDVVDLILGGHDHIYLSKLDHDTGVFI
jgi:hypothetical protein